MERFDVCIIGGGLLGTLAALELSRRSLSCLIAEQNEDFCLEISKANSAILYPGYDHKPGTLKSRLAIEGKQKTAELCEELGIPVLRCGSLMTAKGTAGQEVLWKKYRQGKESRARNLSVLGREETLRLEPCLSPEVTAALYAPDTAVIYPWRLGMAAGRLAESLGAAVWFRTRITEIRREGGTAVGPGAESGGEYILTAENGGEIAAACVVNAAGIRADRVRELLFEPLIRIRPTMADYLVFGREENPGLSHVIFYELENGGKGVTLVPNENGTILAGATDRPFVRQGYETDREGIRELLRQSGEICPALSGSVPIRSFAGLRPNPYEVAAGPGGDYTDTGRSIHSFVIRKEDPEGTFISLLGIKTPGVTASVPIAEYVAGMVEEALRNRKTAVTVPETGHGPDKRPAAVRDLPFAQKRALSDRDPAYGRIVCRCEQVTAGEIRDAIRDGARTVGGVKLRCGAGMGKCQGTRCRAEVERLLEEAAEKYPEKAKPAAAENGTGEKKTEAAGTGSGIEEPWAALPEGLSCDCLIIGAGAAGLSLAAALADRDPSAEILLVDREDAPGGVLKQCLHDGFPVGRRDRMADGPEYRDLLWKEVAARTAAEGPEREQSGGIRPLFGTQVTSLREEGDDRARPVLAEAAARGHWVRIRARCAVLACGAIERTAGMLLIPGSRPEGVYTAGEVQRMLNLENRLPGRRAVLVGTGNMGLIMADLMIRKGMELVKILEKEAHVTATAANIRKYLKAPDSVIPADSFLFGSEVGQIRGLPRVEGITVRDTSSGEETFLPCDTLVLAAGLIPDQELLNRSHSNVKERENGVEGSRGIFLFGNCEHIYVSVTAIRLAAEEMADKVFSYERR